eukprot:5774267-Pyramimonas_sp.AAC.1
MRSQGECLEDSPPHATSKAPAKRARLDAMALAADTPPTRSCRPCPPPTECDAMSVHSSPSAGDVDPFRMDGRQLVLSADLLKHFSQS